MDNELAALQAALAGRYRVEHPVGQGGMGVVYLAHDLKHDRAVAIKVLRPGVATLLGPERFLREIGIAAQLSHPHIVPLHDSGEADGRLYYVMPFVAGETLRERLDKGGKLPPDQALHIIRQVASALSHAHGRGVIHRDIKPSNILLSEGFALVADFGLARALSRVSETEDISSVGLPIGTPRYMSPEQALGDRSLDGRTDLYALGRVLEEMIADPVPAAVTRAVARCLARDPAERFATPEAFIAGLGESAPPVTRRNWKRTALAAGLVFAGGLLFWKVIDTAFSASREPELDTTRIAVLPFDRAPGAPEYQAELPVRSALGRWSGISLVAGVQINEALVGRPAGAIDRALAGRIAREAGAGRFLRGQI
ncbi:MAG TPA: serine/threonine-protein kinase, partial [Gemmatimonadales bacterium]|nr:serine/threonine-protein kinase [Gemmatimonadales bacterium]